MSVYAVIFRGMPAVGALGFGVMAEFVGLRWAFALAGLLCFLAVVMLAHRRRAMIESLETKLHGHPVASG